MTRTWWERWLRDAARVAMPCGIIAMGGCSDDPILTAPDPELHGARHLSDLLTWDLPLERSTQLVRPFLARPCNRRFRRFTDDEPHREFEFWVGQWNVTNLDGVQVGTNDVTSELDGCLIQEHWVASNGVHGTSLNAYDRETGMWHQTWTSQLAGNVFGRLRPSGNLVDGKLTLTGTRDATGGFTFQDTWTWEENDQGQVIQTGAAAVPELNFLSQFTATYTRTETLTPAAPISTGHCTPAGLVPETRQGDFLVGSWTVRSERGLRLGESDIESVLDDCSFVERFDARGGLEAISYIYFDPWLERWFQTYVDSEGERMEIMGAFEDGALVLRGTEGTRHGPVEVTITWRPDGAKLKQIWEVSRDGGATWDHTATLVYTPR